MKAVVRRAAWLVATAALLAGIAGTALAQSGRTLSVAVLNFTNNSGYGGPSLGLSASAAVETALIESGRYDVVKRDLVNKTINDLNLSYPLGRTGIVMLAQALEADAVISGEVMKVSRDAKTNRVTVVLSMAMTDRASGELINGARNAGESGARTGAESSELDLDEAMNKAAFAAVRSLNDRILPEGTVYGTTSVGGETQVTLNIGTNSGVRKGMEFIVLRNGEQVGRLGVTSVDPTFAMAKVISMSRGVQPEDRVRAVFTLDQIPVTTSASRSPRIKRSHGIRMNVGSLLLGAAALFGISELTSGDQATSKAGVRSPIARATGPYNGAPGSDQLPVVPMVQLSWKGPIGVATSDVLGYFIYRQDGTSDENPVRLGEPFLTDIYDTGQAFQRSFATDPESPLDAEDVYVDGLAPGLTLRYYIKMAYVSRTTTGDDTEEEVMASQPAATGQVTPLIPPMANDFNSPIVDPSNVDFSVQIVPGGDRYVIQVADNVLFTNADTYPKSGDGFVEVAPPSPGRLAYYNDDEELVINYDDDPATVMFSRSSSEYTRTFNVNLNTGKIDPNVAGRTLYWRVGVRRSTDAVQPVGGYVWGGWLPLKMASSLVYTKPGADKPGTDPMVPGAPAAGGKGLRRR